MRYYIYIILFLLNYMKKFVIAILIICLVFGVVSFIRLSVPEEIKGSLDDVSENSLSLSSGNSVQQAPQDNLILNNNKISSQSLGVHNKKEDCWIAYDGKVYDVTSFLPRHPGSAKAISPFCGTSDEFTEAFVAKHGASKVVNLMKVGTLIGDFDIVGEI